MVDSGNTYGEKVSRLVSWGHWFTFFNIIATMLIGTRYISQSPWPETLLGQSYLALSWVGHFGFLVFALYLLILFPLTFVVMSRKLYRFIAVCFATLGLTLLLLDTEAYQQIHLHLNPVVWELLLQGEQSNAANELQQLFIVVPIIFMLQLALSEWVWHKQRRLSHKHIGRPIAGLFFVCFIASHLIYIWADAFFYGPITSQRASFPLSYPMTAKTFMEKHGLIDKEEYLKRLAESEEQVDLISYPTEPLQFASRGRKHNILMLMVDNLRADALTAQAMPYTYTFATNNQWFTNHYSASNDSFGVFGLFYGIPNSYASSIKAQGTSPLFLQMLTEQNYDFGLFSGNNFAEPLYYEAIFKSKQVAQSEQASEAYNDTMAIEEWQRWLNATDDTPWFSYIELTTVNNFEDYPGDSDEKATPAQALQSAYYNAVSLSDKHLATILATLADKQLLEDTIVIITSNHGNEFNETNTNSWGSNINYSRYQLQVPLVIHWPQQEAKQYSHRSSHFDVSVTLLQKLTGVSSQPQEYSSGRNLFDESARKWILAGDSREIALITEHNTTVVDQFGNYKVYDASYKRQREAKPKLSILMQGLAELKRFYTREQN